MHEEKIALVREQIAAVGRAAAQRKPGGIYVVACGGSLATLYPVKYLLERETDRVYAESINAAEFCADPPARLGPDSLVILNSQSGTTPETAAAARLARQRGALTAAFTTVPGSPVEQAAELPIYYYDDPVHPYPLLLSIFPEVYQLTFALLDALEGSRRLPEMETAMENLEAVCRRETAAFEPQAREFARAHRTEPVIYTVSAGLDTCVAYILTNCSFMESVWRHSSPLHAGELFHGACEAIGRDTPVVAFLGLGSWRPVEERAVKFLQRITDRLTVLDASALDLHEIPASLRPAAAPLVLHALASEDCLKLSQLTGHPMSSRRYMGVMQY
jgi:fructoselysine 6-phosphate deglycase